MASTTFQIPQAGALFYGCGVLDAPLALKRREIDSKRVSPVGTSPKDHQAAFETNPVSNSSRLWWWDRLVLDRFLTKMTQTSS
jgi:hypothetical protein